MQHRYGYEFPKKPLQLTSQQSFEFEWSLTPHLKVVGTILLYHLYNFVIYCVNNNNNNDSHDNVYGAVCYIVIILFVWFVQEKMNVHLYFDKDQGSWVRLPLAWELYSDFVKELMATIRVMRPFHFRLRPIH